MTVQTAKTVMGLTRVTISNGWHAMNFFFKSRHDAAVFLAALRKRTR